MLISIIGKHPFPKLVVVLVAAALFLSACGQIAASSQTTARGGTVTYAEPPTGAPNYIFPMESGSYLGNTNLFQFDNLIYPPLYEFDVSGKPVLDEALSMAKRPVFSANNTVVAITLKHWMWSNGTPITAGDVMFWMNLLSAATDPKAPAIGSSSEPGPGWGDSVPGGFPENVITYKQTGTYSLTMRLNASYNPTWYLYNELSQITPMPKLAWDKLSSTGSVGGYDASAEARTTLPNTSPAWYVPVNPGTATSGALGVAQFLNSQSENISTYATNPLWQVVAGPFRLTQFTTAGFVKFVPNKSYSGSPKPSIAAFEELPYTSDTSEFNSLESGSLTVGYLPIQDLAEKASLERSQGYSFSPWYNYGTSFFPFNFTNQTTGPMVRQLYFRQAFQSLVNQPAWIKDFQGGYGFTNNGPVPVYPAHDPFESQLEKGKLLYPYDAKRAVALLKAHGWTVIPGGASYCSKPGTAADECGAGVKANQQASLKVVYASGQEALTNEMAAMGSIMKQKAGIELALAAEPSATLASIMFGACTYSAPCNNW